VCKLDSINDLKYSKADSKKLFEYFSFEDEKDKPALGWAQFSSRIVDDKSYSHNLDAKITNHLNKLLQETPSSGTVATLNFISFSGHGI
jgi:hypothetical protein